MCFFVLEEGVFGLGLCYAGYYVVYFNSVSFALLVIGYMCNQFSR